MTAVPDVATVGVFGEVGVDLRSTLEASPIEIVVTSHSLEAVRETTPEAIVCLGSTAIAEAARAQLTVPLVPVDGEPGTRSIGVGALDSALDALASGAYLAVERPLFAVQQGETTRHAFLSVTWMADAGGITEFGLETAGDGASKMPVDRVRADGITLATPTGSQGYAHAAGGAVLGPDTKAASVVPVGAYSIDSDHWVLAPPLWVTVERDESEVTLEVDGEPVTTVPAGSPTSVRAGKTVETIVPECAPGYFRRADRLEKT